jgi:tetratricopeptide (TPR) repeat protein
VAHVSGAAYQKFDFGWAGLMRGVAWRRLGALLLEQFTPIILPLAVLGFTGLPGSRLRLSASVRGSAALLVAASLAFGMRFATEDVEVFFLPAFLGLAIAGGLGLGLLLQHRRRALCMAGWGLAALLGLLPAATHFATHDLRETTAAADYASDILNGVPLNGILFVEGDDANGVLYLHQVLERRPDVTIYNRYGILYRDLASDLSLPARPGENLGTYRARLEQMFIERTLASADHRELLYLGSPGFEVSPSHRLDSFGLLFRVRRADDPAWDDAALWDDYHERSIRRDAERLGSTIALGTAAAYPIARGEKMLLAGDHAGALEALDGAGRLADRSSGVQNYIGALYGEAGDYARATVSFERAVRIMPTLTLAWNNLAIARELAGDVDGAREAWRRLLQITPRHEEAHAQLRRLSGFDAP